MRGHGDAARDAGQDPSVGPVMIAGAPASLCLARDGRERVVLVLEHEWQSPAGGVARGGELRRLEVEDDDDIERRGTVPAAEQRPRTELRPWSIHTPDRQRRDV